MKSEEFSACYYCIVDFLPNSIVISIAVLTVFLSLITAFKYGIDDPFARTRLLMTAFFCFIVATLTICFSQFFLDTLPYTIPAGSMGIALGYLVGVRAAEERIKTEGLMHYMRHFAHVHFSEMDHLTWWNFLNFYSVMSALILINLVGFTTVILHNLKPMALVTSAFGAFLIGSIIPYLIHLWSIKIRQKRSSTTSER
jgi:hypothetical protein